VIVLTAADGRARLDAVLRRRLPQLSRRAVQAAIAAGVVRVNGRRARKGRAVGPGDRIDVGPLDREGPPRPEIDIPILFVDATLIALDKPPGLPATARVLSRRASVAGFLLACYPELAHVAPSPFEAGLVHRLDTETSGVLLVARTAEAWRALRAQFRHRAVTKDYVALVHGRLAAAQRLCHRLSHDPRAADRMAVVTPVQARRLRRSRPSWLAEATLTPITSTGDTTLVRLRLHTGVTHQLRVQLAAAGHPIVGDARYGEAPRPDLPPRHLLHATRITVRHPTEARLQTVRSRLPTDFTAALARLGYRRPAPG
jgi:23S rRNA pseudouridine1911/1915/1917 synthase